jgi:hypothetical protein
MKLSRIDRGCDADQTLTEDLRDLMAGLGIPYQKRGCKISRLFLHKWGSVHASFSMLKPLLHFLSHNCSPPWCPMPGKLGLQLPHTL